jgi:hypothetical protein
MIVLRVLEMNEPIKACKESPALLLVELDKQFEFEVLALLVFSELLSALGHSSFAFVVFGLAGRWSSFFLSLGFTLHVPILFVVVRRVCTDPCFLKHLAKSNLVVKPKRTALAVFTLAVNTTTDCLGAALTSVLACAGNRDFKMFS